jgi:hypothetical protein
VPPFIRLLFTNEQDISESFSLAFYRQSRGEAPTGIGPIEREIYILGEWPNVQTANVTIKLSVMHRHQFLPQLQINL